MDVSDLLLDAHGRIAGHVARSVDGLDAEALAAAPAPGTNTVAWLVWHLTRVEDDHVAEVMGTDQLWVVDGWAARFGRPPDPHDTGYGHDAEQVAGVRPDGPEALVAYHSAVAARTRTFLERLSPTDLDRVVDERWDPPVTLGVRLVSVIDDQAQHAGQAAYLRGLLGRP